MGDVNQKNLMVSKKGIVALVDCDSFQVKEGNRIFRCGVGVPEYTPPEIHGRKFTDLDRNANHDVFGLAVMVFQLLMMGRHPFAGVPQLNVDIPIEKAIKEGLYAYARNPSKLKPPPHIPPMAMLDAPIRELFERAFGSIQRPTATEWRYVLDASMKGLKRCKNDPKHSYTEAAGSCPWCQLIAVARLMFFIPSQGAGGAALRIEDIRNLIQKLTSMQLAFRSYIRPKPILPVEVMLPANLRQVRKPVFLHHPAPPAPVQKPRLAPSPPPPVLVARPKLRPLPPAPAIPLSPLLKPYPPSPVRTPPPTLNVIPPPPVYPPVPTPVPDRFLDRLFAIGAAAGGLVYFVASPVGVTMMFGFGVWWLVMKVTEGMRHAIAQKSLKELHDAEYALMEEEYMQQSKPIQRANEKLLLAWKAANAAVAAEHAQLCRVIGDENRRTTAPWEASKAKIEADHQRVTQEVNQANGRVLLDWETENAARQAAYDQARRKIELENHRLTSAWAALTASCEAEHRHKCDEIDTQNRRTNAAWEAANAPWIDAQQRWRDRASFAGAEIKRLEDGLVTQRSTIVSRFQLRKLEAEGVLKSHEGALHDYERELHQAEMDSQKIQLEEHLDNSLVRRAKLKGITGDRILSLESFGIETAKDVAMLNHQKVPGIGPVLSKRLFDWRDKIASSFQPRRGLPESERRRVATRYTPVLLPLEHALQSAINDLETIAASHRAIEAERIKTIAAAVNELTVAEAYVRAMTIV